MLIPPFDPSARQLPFAKFHGAGNDFILVDDPQAAFPADDATLVARLCTRRTGIGADGLILLRPARGEAASGGAAEGVAVRMVFRNSDGTPAAMCGNGARCLACFAHLQDRAPAAMHLATDAGLLAAEILPPPATSASPRMGGAALPDGTTVRIQLPPPSALRLDIPIDYHGKTYLFHHLDTGVPHAVHFLPPGATPDDLAAFPLAELGPYIRHHPAFAPAGANIDICLVLPPATLRIRTYERGVEAETLACGTGSTAAACLADRLRLLPDTPITVLPLLNTPFQVTPPAPSSPLPSLVGPVHLSYTALAPLP